MSAEGKLFVNPQELEAISGRVDEQVASYRACFDGIYNEVETLKTTWSGEANLAFVAQIEGFKSDFESMQKLLAKYAEFLRVASNNYQRSENINIENARIDLAFGN